MKCGKIACFRLGIILLTVILSLTRSAYSQDSIFSDFEQSVKVLPGDSIKINLEGKIYIESIPGDEAVTVSKTVTSAYILWIYKRRR